MGKLITTGKSMRKVEPDVMEITIDIISKEVYEDKAIDRSEKSTEEILGALRSLGIDISKIESDGQRVSKREWYHDDDWDTHFEYGRRLQFEVEADVKLANQILSAVKRDDIEVEVQVTYRVSNIAEIHEELKLEALKDAKVKAEAMAEILGEEIQGVYEAVAECFNTYARIPRDAVMCCEAAPGRSDTPLADELGIRKDFESETISVTWLLKKKN